MSDLSLLRVVVCFALSEWLPTELFFYRAVLQLLENCPLLLPVSGRYSSRSFFIPVRRISACLISSAACSGSLLSIRLFIIALTAFALFCISVILFTSFQVARLLNGSTTLSKSELNSCPVVNTGCISSCYRSRG